MKPTHVGAAAGCDLLTLIVKKQDQKIAACGSSYMDDLRHFSIGYLVSAKPLSKTAE
jgi:hypothetical protein